MLKQDILGMKEQDGEEDFLAIHWKKHSWYSVWVQVVIKTGDPLNHLTFPQALIILLASGMEAGVRKHNSPKGCLVKEPRLFSYPKKLPWMGHQDYVIKRKLLKNHSSI